MNHENITSSTKVETFSSELSAVINQKLKPESILTYTETALNSLVDLTNDVVTAYRLSYPSTEIDNQPAARLEDQAYQYYGMGNISEILDYILSVDEKIKSVANFALDITTTKPIIVPSERTDQPTRSSKVGPVIEKRRIPRLETVLFLLEEEFNVDINDKNQLKAIAEEPNSESKREGYRSLDVLKLNRLIFVCNTEGNVSFVFNKTVMAQHDLSTESLFGLTKDDLNKYIASINGLGCRIIYSEDFIKKIVSAIYDVGSLTGVNSELLSVRESYLIPNEENHIESLASFAKKIGLDPATVNKVINDIGPDELGERPLGNFHNSITEALTTVQQEQIITRAQKMGYLAIESSQETVYSMSGIAIDADESKATIRNVINYLKRSGQLGEVNKGLIGSLVTDRYSGGQRQMILTRLEQWPPIYDEDFISHDKLAVKLGIDKVELTEHVSVLDLGEIQEYYLKIKTTLGYNQIQEAIITKYVKATKQ